MCVCHGMLTAAAIPLSLSADDCSMVSMLLSHYPIKPRQVYQTARQDSHAYALKQKDTEDSKITLPRCLQMSNI
jgi:hypothetical protein